MARPPPAAALIGSPEEVEAQFYEAMRRGDLERMMSLWADDDEIVCVHPGGGRIVGAAAIRASFAAIFANGGVPAQPQQVHRVAVLGAAVHHLVERIEVRRQPGERGATTAWVIATNVYLKTAQGWRLAAHHASPALAQEPAEAPHEAPSTLH